ncbi:MAG: recombination mediator RecR [Candidatus Paceibacterota bacterium]
MSQKVKKLIEQFSNLPGIGPRQATRLVLAMLEWAPEELDNFSNAITELKSGPTLCTVCFNFADTSQCAICASTKRDKTRIAVVEKVTDLESMEKTGSFNGVYHVLGGIINPASGTLPAKLKIAELVKRVEKLKGLTADIEVIIATNPNTHGETTALYLEEELRPLDVKMTRLARGLASGSSLEYADEITLANALKHRK